MSRHKACPAAANTVLPVTGWPASPSTPTALSSAHGGTPGTPLPASPFWGRSLIYKICFFSPCSFV